MAGQLCTAMMTVVLCAACADSRPQVNTTVSDDDGHDAAQASETEMDSSTPSGGDQPPPSDGSATFDARPTATDGSAAFDAGPTAAENEAGQSIMPGPDGDIEDEDAAIVEEEEEEDAGTVLDGERAVPCEEPLDRPSVCQPRLHCLTVAEITELPALNTLAELAQQPPICLQEAAGGLKTRLDNVCGYISWMAHLVERCRALAMEVVLGETRYNWRFHEGIDEAVQSACWGSFGVSAADCLDATQWDEDCVTTDVMVDDVDAPFTTDLPRCWRGRPEWRTANRPSEEEARWAAQYCTRLFSQRLESPSLPIIYQDGAGRQSWLSHGPAACTTCLEAGVVETAIGTECFFPL